MTLMEQIAFEHYYYPMGTCGLSWDVAFSHWQRCSEDFKKPHYKFADNLIQSLNLVQLPEGGMPILSKKEIKRLITIYGWDVKGAKGEHVFADFYNVAQAQWELIKKWMRGE